MKNANKFQQVKYIANSIRKKYEPNDFCAAPFTQMFLYPTGDAYVCCEGGGYLGNIKENTLEQLWNGEKAQTLRQEFLDGKPKQCRKNIDCKACNKSYDDQLITGEITKIQMNPPKNLDLILNGKCNIDCIMCEVKNETRSLLDIENFHSEIVEKIIPKAEMISVKSGEPFVQKETFWLINKLNEVNPDCNVRFTTNGQYNFNDKLKFELNKINVEKITFSIDSIFKDTFEKIREKGSLSKLLKAIEDIKNWIKEEKDETQIELHANFTLQKDNWRDAPETLKYLFENKIIPHIITVEKPTNYSINDLNDDEFLEVVVFYLNLGQEYNRLLHKLLSPIVALCKTRNSVKFDKLAILLKKKMSDYAKNNIVCTLPFTQMSIFPNGKIRPCCWLNNYEVRSEKDGDFLKAWNDEPIQKIRKQFIENKLTICKSNVSKTSCNSRNGLPSDFFEISHTINRPPQKLHWYFSGSCNLECPSCRNWQFNEEFPESDIYWQKLKTDVFPHLCEIEVVGGEPFYQKRTFQLIDTLSTLNKNCLWYITSNGQFNFKGKIEDSLRKIRISYFSVSIDSLEIEKFNQIRKNGVLQKTINFLDDLIDFNKSLELKFQFRIMVNFVLQKDNYTELESMLKFVKNKGVKLYIIPLVGPAKLSIYELSSQVKLQILANIKYLKNSYNDNALNFSDIIQDLENHLANSAHLSTQNSSEIAFRIT